jgi:hypothetical protein
MKTAESRKRTQEQAGFAVEEESAKRLCLGEVLQEEAESYAEGGGEEADVLAEEDSAKHVEPVLQTGCAIAHNQASTFAGGVFRFDGDLNVNQSLGWGESEGARSGGVCAEISLDGWFHYQERNRTFVGRAAELDMLTKLLGDHRSATVVPTGVAGIGKTQLVLEWVHQHRQEYAMVAWLRAENR